MQAGLAVLAGSQDWYSWTGNQAKIDVWADTGVSAGGYQSRASALVQGRAGPEC